MEKEQSAKAKLKDGSKSSNQALLAAVEEDKSLTTIMLAENFNVDHSTIVRHLKKLGKVWKLAGWVPHKLFDKNREERVYRNIYRIAEAK